MSAFRLLGPTLTKAAVKTPNGGHLLRVSSAVKNQSATMIGVDRKDPEIDRNKPKPWPYLTKRRSPYLHYLFDIDSTPARFDMNSKILVVEGNKGSGKEEVAKELAKRFGLLHMPEIDLVRDLYVNHKGFDYRTLNKYIDPLVQAVDEKMFYEQPNHKGVNWMKIYFYVLRYRQYIDALAHLYNTGQGVILERSPYSDFVFAEAMHKSGYFKDDAHDYYYRVRHASIYDLQRPHLVIYLDVPAEECLRRIKKRNIPHEVNSEVFKDKKYLQVIEDTYKNRYLPEAARASEVMIYDWSEYGDVDDMVDDIEKVNLDDWDPHHEKFEDWNLYEEDLWEQKRHLYTNKKYSLCILTSHMVPIYDTPSLCVDPDIGIHRDKVYKNLVPNYEVLPSYDPDVVPVWKRLLRWRPANYREEDEFSYREPFF